MASQADSPRNPGAQIERRVTGEANLTFFLVDRLHPILRQIDSIDSFSDMRANFVKVELLETFLWLHLGVEIDYFPRDLARRAAYEFFPEFLKAYDSVFSEASFDKWFSSPMRVILESEFTGRQELFSARGVWKSEGPPPEALVTFQSSLVLANGFAQNSESRPLFQALVMSKDSEWQESVEMNRPIEGLEQHEVEQDGALEKHWAYPGFFAGVDYMHAARQKIIGMRQELGRTTQEFEDYLRQVKETQQWRLNFGDPTYRHRFTQIGRMAGKTFVQYSSAAELGDSESAVKTFLNQIYDLMTDWGAPPIAMAAGGAA